MRTLIPILLALGLGLALPCGTGAAPAPPAVVVLRDGASALSPADPQRISQAAPGARRAGTPPANPTRAASDTAARDGRALPATNPTAGPSARPVGGLTLGGTLLWLCLLPLVLIGAAGLFFWSRGRRAMRAPYRPNVGGPPDARYSPGGTDAPGQYAGRTSVRARRQAAVADGRDPAAADPAPTPSAVPAAPAVDSGSDGAGGTAAPVGHAVRAPEGALDAPNTGREDQG